MEPNTNINPETTPTGAPETPPEGGGTTFTQAEVDTIVSREKAKAEAKAKKGMPSAEELTAFNTWKASQQTEQQKWEELNRQKDEAVNALTDAQKELEQYRREAYLLSQGINKDDVDYYAYKIGKMVNDNITFEQAAARFLAEHKPTSTSPTGVRMATGPQGSTGAVKMSLNDIINAKLRGQI